MERKKINLRGAFSVAVLLGALSGCGGGKDSTTQAPNNPPDDPPPATIQGIATPTGIAVVTATNAD